MALLVAGCGSEESEPVPVIDDTCHVLFGAPAENTGLDDSSCQPKCACGGVNWQPPTYTQSDIDALAQRVLLDPPELLEDEDPYQDPASHVPEPDAMCAVVGDAQQAGAYRVQTFADRQQAEQAGATPTHCGACGRCSSLADLAAYMNNPDLTEPVRACGIEGMSAGKEANIECLQNLGFTLPCAEIWYYNTLHTRTVCLEVCMAALSDPYHLPDGTLNPCLQCDEDKSGPVFKAVAGRTRRNTGLASALCRPCPSVCQVVHVYP